MILLLARWMSLIMSSLSVDFLFWMPKSRGTPGTSTGYTLNGLEWIGTALYTREPVLRGKT